MSKETSINNIQQQLSKEEDDIVTSILSEINETQNTKTEDNLLKTTHVVISISFLLFYFCFVYFFTPNPSGPNSCCFSYRYRSPLSSNFGIC